jgi:hypothetical protein
MKSVFAVLVFAGITGIVCSAQDLTTIELCRAYRDAWNTSFNDELPHLTVAELMKRSKQIDNCVTQIDKEPNLVGMKYEEALRSVASTRNYLWLSKGYYYELFRRMGEYMVNNRLIDGFLNADNKSRQEQVPKP